MKKPSILLLLLLSLILPLFSETPETSKSNSAAEYGIDLKATYSGQEVWDLLQTVLTESDSAIDEAYVKGYTAGSADTVYYKHKYETEKRDKWIFGLSGLGIGALAQGGGDPASLRAGAERGVDPARVRRAHAGESGRRRGRGAG